jgi:hypothetical protein
MKCTIDRIEGEIAVLILQDDPRQRITVPAAILPAGCGEGDILTLVLEADPLAAGAARERVSELLKKLKENR